MKVINRHNNLSHTGQNYWMLIGWKTRHFLLTTRALWVNQEGMTTWSWLTERASAVSSTWFPAETRWNEFWKSFERDVALLRFECNHFINRERKSLCRNERGIVEWKEDFLIQIRFPQPEEKHQLDGIVEIHGSWVWKFTSRHLIFKTEATLSFGNSRRFAGCEKKNGSFKTFLQLVRTLCLRISLIQKFSISTRTKQASQKRWIKLNRFYFYL